MTGALIVGWGVTGQAVCRYLRTDATDATDATEVTIVDDHPSVGGVGLAGAAGARLLAAPTEAQLAQLVAASAFVVPSPGVPLAHAVYRMADQAGVPVLSEIELAWRRLVAAGRGGAGRPRLVAVTGTNGKTTVTTLIAAILAASGGRAVAAGNIGLPLLDAVVQPTDVVVAEVSSFQLAFTEAFRPDVSCWLNLAEDHLDWHPTMGHYASAKARIWANQGDGDIAVLNAGDRAVMAAAGDPDQGVPAGVQRRTFSTAGEADFHVDAIGRLLGPDGALLVDAARLRRALPHDLANGLAAAACALAVGATPEGCRQALENFETLPHRVQLIGEAGGVRWYDDSKATTPASVLAAVAGFESVVLIAGGRNKGLDLGPLAEAAPPVRSVIAIGEAADDIERAFSGRVPVIRAGSMADAVAAAMAESRAGDVVLLSPGCASFDWYHSYGERGDDFTRLVTARLQHRGAPA
jgi:UDP-N-acetylmuramoylalanine--D-glutamate ligase